MTILGNLMKFSNAVSGYKNLRAAPLPRLARLAAKEGKWATKNLAS